MKEYEANFGAQHPVFLFIIIFFWGAKCPLALPPIGRGIFLVRSLLLFSLTLHFSWFADARYSPLFSLLGLSVPIGLHNDSGLSMLFMLLDRRPHVDANQEQLSRRFISCHV